uniref:Uncharacterized protein n=1 Tax=Rhizophora mucronata TaxID=61149 RepID=A0A2P2QJV4_RHIMU
MCLPSHRKANGCGPN